MGVKAERTKIRDKHGNKITYRQAIKMSIKGTIDDHLPGLTHKSSAKMRKGTPYRELSDAIVMRKKKL